MSDTVITEIDRRMKKLNEIRPFEGIYLRQIHQFFKIETTYSSNAIEGNTHTLEETKVILEDGITIGGHPLREFYEIEGHGQAYDYMFSLIKKRELTEEDILYCHRLFSKNILGFTNPGKYRETEVLISGSKKVLPKAKDVPLKMEKYIEWIKQKRDTLFPVSIPVLRRSDYYNVLERNKAKDFGNYIAELELQTIKDLMRYLHVESF